MSVVEDVRKAMQDFLAPELGKLMVRVEALEKRVDELKLETRNGFREAEVRAEKRQDELMTQMRQVLNYALLEERMTRLEGEQKRLLTKERQ